MTRGERRNLYWGLFFVSPTLVGFTVFMAVPILLSVYYSLCDYPILEEPTFIGFQNYYELFLEPNEPTEADPDPWPGDQRFWQSLEVTFIFTFVAVPLGIVVAFFLALLLNLKVQGQAFYRTIFFLPSIVPIVAASVLWAWVFHADYGILNSMIRGLFNNEFMIRIGLGPIQPPLWLDSEDWALPALIIMSVWGVGGTMVLYLAGLQEVPQHLYEAADIDGASPWQKTMHVTIPIISPVIFFTFIMGLIGTFQYFTQAYIMTGGGPSDSTLFYALYLYQNAFEYYKLGYASAMAWILFVIILLVTLVVFRGTGRYVYYEGK